MPPFDIHTGRITYGAAASARNAGLGGTVPRTSPASAVVASTAQPVELPIRLFPPVNWENLDIAGYITIGNQGTTVTIFSYTVPIGRNGIVNKISNAFVGGGFQEGQGNLVWRVLVDGGTPPGANTYNNILGSLGAMASPTPIAGFRIFENQTITFVAENISLFPAQQLVGARLLGYLYPRELEESDIWT
jgi:hypothetical protein